MESICVAVTFNVDTHSATYGWSIQGGCFENGRIANYKMAHPGTNYSFDKLDFEVREYSPTLAEAIGSIFALTRIFRLLSTLCLIGAIVAAAILLYQYIKNRNAV